MACQYYHASQIKNSSFITLAHEHQFKPAERTHSAPENMYDSQAEKMIHSKYEVFI